MALRVPRSRATYQLPFAAAAALEAPALLAPTQGVLHPLGSHDGGESVCRQGGCGGGERTGRKNRARARCARECRCPFWKTSLQGHVGLRGCANSRANTRTGEARARINVLPPPIARAWTTLPAAFPAPYPTACESGVRWRAPSVAVDHSQPMAPKCVASPFQCVPDVLPLTTP